MSSNEIPVVFGAPRSLRVLNVVAVATSLAAFTSAACMAIGRGGSTWAVVAGVPTFFIAWLWALCLRWQKETTGFGLRWGWFLSIPLAALNGALTCGAFFTASTPGRAIATFPTGALLGATFGILCWGPALVLVLLLFGVPIAHAQKLAKRGLAGEERGEQIVGSVSALVGVAAMALAQAASSGGYVEQAWTRLATPGAIVLHALALAAIACGGAAAIQATRREARRRRFIERVEALEEPGYRVEPTPAGKVLLRVAPLATYRVADRAEELFELDDEGRAMHRA